MAQISIPIILFILLLLLQAAATTTTEPTHNGFTLELIHRYSHRSPFHFNRNLTDSQLLQRLIEQSVSRVQWLESTNTSYTTTLRIPIIFRDSLYSAKLGIGTGRSSRPYHLGFDTGSWFTWVRCEPCDPCYRHPDQPFNPDESPTYVQLRGNNPICTPPFKSDHNGMCAYDTDYNDGTRASGVVSQETFTFQSNHHGRPEAIPSLTFGCTHSSYIRLNGVIGMGPGQLSIPNQLGPRRTGGRFSYCLVEPWSRASGYLRFGDDIPERGRFQRTPILHGPGLHIYYVHLNGISIGNQRFGNQRLDVGRETFAHRGTHGGSVFDTGSTLTHLISPAYIEVRSMLHEFLGRILGRVSDSGYYHTDVCYLKPSHMSELPHMTLHLEGADYHIESENLFMFDNRRGIFCLAMTSSNHATIIGATQQYNVRFSYDLRINELSFAPENCEHDADQ